MKKQDQSNEQWGADTLDEGLEQIIRQGRRERREVALRPILVGAAVVVTIVLLVAVILVAGGWL